MKRFDIELYAKSTLQNYTLSIRKDGWEHFLAQLHKKEQKRDQKFVFLKAALFITVFVAGFGTLTNNRIQHLNIPITANEGILKKPGSKKTAIKTEDIEVEKRTAPNIAHKNSPVTENVSSEEIVTNEEFSADIKEWKTHKTLALNNASFEEFKSKPKIQVTDAELDSLMRIARANIEMERIIRKQQEQELLTADGLLADAMNVEEDALYENKKTSPFNHLLWEFLKIKSAFAN